MTDRETAEALGATVNTIRSHRAAILRRLHSDTMVQAAVKYERERAETEARQQLVRAIEADVPFNGTVSVATDAAWSLPKGGD